MSRSAPSFFQSEFADHIAAAERAAVALEPAFERLTAVCRDSLARGGKILFFGNGGSASDAQHLATELVVRYRRNRPALAALSLSTDTSALTAIGNDFGFEHLFARQIEALGRPGDVAIGITTSGRSPNITLALKQARDMGLVAAALSGRDGGELPGLADPLLIVPSDVTARIQEMHILLGHMLCETLEETVAGG